MHKKNSKVLWKRDKNLVKDNIQKNVRKTPFLFIAGKAQICHNLIKLTQKSVSREGKRGTKVGSR